jgi:hypothetical protein
MKVLGYNIVFSVESQPTIRRNTSPSSSGSKKAGGMQFLPPAFMLVSCLSYSSTLKMEAKFPPIRRLTLTVYMTFYPEIVLFTDSPVR